MSIRGTKRITVHKVIVKEGSLFSPGIGFDDYAKPIDFIGHTDEMKNIKEAIEDFEDDHKVGRPTIFLKPWQWEDTQ